MHAEQLIDLVFVVESPVVAARLLEDVFTRGWSVCEIEGTQSSPDRLSELRVSHRAAIAAESAVWPGVGTVLKPTAQVIRETSGYQVEVTFALHDVV